MKSFRPTNLHELRRFKGIKINDIKKAISKQQWYNILDNTHKPRQDTKEKLCEIFEIDMKTFDTLLKNTIKLYKKKINRKSV